jgi:ribose 5-phosphate isomerase A
LAAPDVARELVLLGCTGVPKIRQGGSAKAGPIVTDNGMWIIDAPFKPLLLPKDLEDGKKGEGEDGVWEVSALARRLESIFGVLAVGVFYGTTGFDVAGKGGERGGQRPVAAFFGMADGSVQVRSV